jgi:hypothetical protein
MTSERKNIAEPSEWWKAAEAAAKKENKSLSEWIGEAILEKLPAKVRSKLPERVTAGRPRKEE